MTDIIAQFKDAYLAGNWAKQSEIQHAYGDQIDFSKIPICLLHNYCNNGDLANVKALLEAEPDLYADYNALYNSCIYGHIHIAKHLYSCYSDADKSKLFIACRNNHSDATYFERIFSMSCKYNQLEVAKWLYSIYPTIVSCAEFIKTFDHLCCAGNIEFVKWLLTIVDPNNKPKDQGYRYNDEIAGLVNLKYMKN